MGTPVPVREIIEAKRKEIEEKLLRELTDLIKDGRMEYVDDCAGSIAKFKMNLYSAYKVEEVDLMGFSINEVEVEDVEYRLYSNDLVVSLTLPNRARYTIYVVPKPTYEMPKEEFEKYTALKEEVMREASKIALETKVKELEDELEELKEKYNTLAEFIRAKGLQEEFVKYVAEKRRQEEEEEIREEFEELFEEEDEEDSDP